MNLRLRAANTNDASPDSVSGSAHSPLLLEWLTRITHPELSVEHALLPADRHDCVTLNREPRAADWVSVANICGHTKEHFLDAGGALPLAAAEIDYFRRNHRGTESHISRDFLTAQTDLPSPLAELYGLYRHRARIDAEAALWVAQSTTSLRVASIMADLLSIGGFANALEYISYMGVTYAVPCAFDTSGEIDHANQEARRRLALPPDHPSHLLRLRPDELGVLASSIAERNALPPAEFLEKANLLSEGRQDVTRLPHRLHFATAVSEHDLPLQAPWAERMVSAFAHRLPHWVLGLPEVQAILG
ncbi:MAG: hypothetical protein PHE27_05155 [Alphaproteobacteria bacterium]|nr:hypothetical protein [Alphaproteobacteria bacterium]